MENQTVTFSVTLSRADADELKKACVECSARFISSITPEQFIAECASVKLAERRSDRLDEEGRCNGVILLPPPSLEIV